jgi:RNA polymerase sigma factor (TIGR02999 family)
LPPAIRLEASELLPLVYGELRRIAASKMGRESPNHTLQPTALVHEAWLRMVRTSRARFEGRAQFFAVAAEAMRRILVESARRKLSLKRGQLPLREDLDESQILQQSPSEEMLAVHEALDRLADYDSTAAELVKLRYFVGMTMDEAATALASPCGPRNVFGPSPGPGCARKSPIPGNEPWSVALEGSNDAIPHLAFMSAPRPSIPAGARDVFMAALSIRAGGTRGVPGPGLWLESRVASGGRSAPPQSSGGRVPGAARG